MLFSTYQWIALLALTGGSRGSKTNVLNFSMKFQRYESFSSFSVFSVSCANFVRSCIEYWHLATFKLNFSTTNGMDSLLWIQVNLFLCLIGQNSQKMLLLLTFVCIQTRNAVKKHKACFLPLRSHSKALFLECHLSKIFLVMFIGRDCWYVDNARN